MAADEGRAREGERREVKGDEGKLVDHFALLIKFVQLWEKTERCSRGYADKGCGESARFYTRESSQRRVNQEAISLSEGFHPVSGPYIE